MLNSIQYLRAIAAFAVVLSHLAPTARFAFSFQTAIDDVLAQGKLGVHVFFVLSGFIISYMIIQKKQGRKEFTINRISRIVPPYWTLTLALGALLLTLPSIFAQRSFSFLDLLLALSFSAWIENKYPVIGVGWTLTYEIIFYALVIAFYKWIPKLNGRAFLAIVTCLGLLPLATTGFMEVCNPLFYLEFLVGIMILFERERMLDRRLAIAVFGAILLVELYWNRDDVLAGTLLGASLLFFFLKLEMRFPSLFQSKTIVALGNASYSTYLLQVFTLPLVVRAIKLSGGGGILFSLSAPFVTLAISYAFYRLFEMRLFGYTKNALRRTFNCAGTLTV